MNEMLLVEIDEQGVIHEEDGQLIVGDLRIMEAALKAWGGSRQRGRVLIQIYVQPRQMTNSSPDFNGTFAEKSEPAA